MDEPALRRGSAGGAVSGLRPSRVHGDGATWTRCLELGTNVVLDFGFWSRHERDRARELVRAHGGRTVLYSLECPDDLAWQRIATRNERLNGSLYIAPETFRVLRDRFEPLEPDEERVEVRA